MKEDYQFEIEGARVDIPKHFDLFSVMVGDFMKSYDENSDYSCIPLPDYRKECLLKIIEFFHIFESDTGDTAPPEKATPEKAVSPSWRRPTVAEEKKPGAVKAATDEASDSFKHLSHDMKVVSLPQWASQFFDDMQKEVFFETCILANFMLAHPFIEHAALYIANKLKSLDTVAEMRDYLNTQADFAEDEFDVLAGDPDWRKRLVAEGLWKPKDGCADVDQPANVSKTVR